MELQSPLWFQIIGVLLGLVALSGNGLTIGLIVGRRILRTSTNCLVLSLALADFACGGAQLGSVFSDCSFHGSRGGCISVSSVLTYFLYVSVISLCCLTLERYVAVLNPLRYLTIMTPRRIGFLITLSWVLPLPVFVAPHIAIHLVTSGKSSQYFLAVFSLFQVCVCLGLVFVTARILRSSWRHRRQAALLHKQLRFNHELERTTALTADTNSNSVKVVASVVAMFVTCYSFDIHSHMCQLGFCHEPDTVSYITPLLKLLNSAANPIAYAFFKVDIKNELRRCFRRSRKVRHASLPQT